MKSFMAGVLAELVIILGIAAVYFYWYPEPPVPEEVTVKQISGEKIDHSGFDYKSGSIKFTTKAEGKGEIITEIPKVNIPEARYWLENNNALMLELLLTEEDRIYGLSYMRRWGNVSAGGGVLVSGKRFEGIKTQVQYSFSL